MSDDIPVDLCHGKMNASLRLPPTEVWTDVFNLLPRHILVKQVQPINHWFKEICDKNVKCVHLITKADQFTDKLKKGDPEAKKQVKDLAGNKCKLADHFRLELELNQIEISYKSKAILRHCSDLFNRCVVSLNIRWINSLTITQSLDHLEETKPLAIQIFQHVDQITTFWHHSTVRDCRWIYLESYVPLSADPSPIRTCVAISDWLHHRRPMEDCVEGAAAPQIRRFFGPTDPVNVDGLLNLCLEALQSSQGPADRRQFVLCFIRPVTDLMTRFGRIENEKTGEVLQLERVTDEFGPVIDHWRLQRCLANEVAIGMEEIYAKIKQVWITPEVVIQ